MVAVGVFAGISFGSYANGATNLYNEVYDGDEGINLPDIWVDNPSQVWDGNQSSNLCTQIQQNWPESDYQLQGCESRLVLDGIMFHINSDGQEKVIPAVWHGIDEGDIDRVWMPDDKEFSSGRTATQPDEIVIDGHAAIGMEIEVGDFVSIGAGTERANFTVVGIGYHSQHLYFAQEGVILPAEEGTFVTGYMTDLGLENLANMSTGSSNKILIDVKGVPNYDLLSTANINEGEKLNLLIEVISEIISSNDDAPSSVYDRSGVESVEFLRADAEGAIKMFPYVTGMLAVIAGITIFLSLQRLIQSQAKEIAVLRTLGVPKTAIMPAYILAATFIGVIGSIIGIILGVFVGAPGMLRLYQEIIGLPIDLGVDSTLISQIVIIAMLIVIIAGIRPAWQASRLQPLTVFRGNHEVKLASRNLQRLTSKLPTTIGLSIRSSLRRPMRLGITFFAVAISMLLFGSMLFMMASMEKVMIGGIEDNQSWDVQAYTPPDGEQPITDWVIERNGTYELMINFPLGIEGDNRELQSFGLDKFSTVEDDNAMIMVELLEGELPVKGSSSIQVMVDEGTSSFLDWDVGEKVTIEVGSNPLEVEISGITKGEVLRTMYFHRAELSQAVGINSTSVLIDLDGEIDSIEGLGEKTLGYSLKKDMVSSFETLLEKQQKMLTAIQFLGIIIAMAVLFNTLLINLAERDTELATIRVLGAPMKKLGAMMFWEHLVIGLLGGILGAIFAYFGTVLLVNSFVQWAFFFTVEPQISPIFTIISIVTIISIALTPIGIRRIKKMDLVEKVKEFSH